MSQNNDYVEDYLMHHGVQGQKWGVRRANEKLQIQRKKTQLAELKALEAISEHQKKEAKKSSSDVNKEHVKNGKRIAWNVLKVGSIAALTVGALIKHERKTWAKGSSATAKILKKGHVTRRTFHY